MPTASSVRTGPGRHRADGLSRRRTVPATVTARATPTRATRQPRPLQVVAGHQEHRRHPQPGAPPEGGETLEDGPLHSPRVRGSGLGGAPPAGRCRRRGAGRRCRRTGRGRRERRGRTGLRRPPAGAAPSRSPSAPSGSRPGRRCRAAASTAARAPAWPPAWPSLADRPGHGRVDERGAGHPVEEQRRAAAGVDEAHRCCRRGPGTAAGRRAPRPVVSARRSRWLTTRAGESPSRAA